MDLFEEYRSSSRTYTTGSRQSTRYITTKIAKAGPKNGIMAFHNAVIPTPIEGEGGGGQNQPVEFHFFSWKPWDSDPIAQMEF